MKVPHDPDEVIAVVNDRDEIIGEATRKEVHEKGQLHREICVYLMNSKNQVLLQKRMDRPVWDSSSSGHFPKDQNYEEGAIRETEEELGIKLQKDELKEIGYEKLKVFLKYNGITNYKFNKAFLVRKDIPIGNFDIDRKEIEEIRYFDKKSLESLLKAPYLMTPTNEIFIKKYILKELQ